MGIRFELPDPRTCSGFVADMHFHSEHSHDCDTPVGEIVREARKRGIHVALTDHNSVGGVREALRFKEAPIIPGIELCSREGKEIIIYFYAAEELLAFDEGFLQPRIRRKNALRSSRTRIPIDEIISAARKHRCVLHIPHPFAVGPRRSYMFYSAKKRRALLDAVDSVEVFNSMLTRHGNLLGAGWALQIGKGVAGGSDGHELRLMGRGVTVSKARTVGEHLDAIKRGDVEVIGKELRQHERVLVGRRIIQTKLRRGITDSLQFPIQR